MTDGRRAGAKMRHITDQVASEKSRRVKAKVTAVGTRGTSVLKCQIPSTGETVYVEAAAATDMVDLSANDYVWLSRMDDGKRNKWFLEGLAETSAGSHVPPLRKDAVAANIDLDDLADVDAATPTDGELLGWVDANSAWEPLSSGGVVNGVTKTVKASGGDYTTIQDAIDYFKGKTCFGANVIDVEAGTYDEKLDFSSIALGAGATLTLQGDTRTVVGLTYVGGKSDATAWAASTAYSLNDVVKPTAGNETGLFYVCTSAGTSGAAEPTWDADIGDTTTDNTVTWTGYGIDGNPGELTNGGDGHCTIDKSGSNGLSIYTWTTAPDFTTAGIVNGDKVLVYDATPTVAEYTVNQVNAALDYVLDLTTTSPTMSADGCAACILPNRRIEPTSAGQCITVDTIRGIVVQGFYLESHTGTDCHGIVATNGANVTVKNTCSKCEDFGLYSDSSFSTIQGIDGAVSHWSCSRGVRALGNAQALCRYQVAVACAYGFESRGSSYIQANYSVATGCTSNGIRADIGSKILCSQAAARGCATGYLAANRSYMYAIGTDENNYGNTTDYDPATSDAMSSDQSSIRWS